MTRSVFIPSLLVLAAAIAPNGSASAQARLEARERSVAATVEVIDVDKVSGPALGLGAALDQDVTRWLQVGASVGYWAREQGATSDPGYRASDLMLGGHARLVTRALDAPVRPFVQGGLDLHRLSVLHEAPAAEDPLSVARRRDLTRFGGSGAVGVLFPLGDATAATARLTYRQIFGGVEDRFDQLAFGAGVQRWL